MSLSFTERRRLRKNFGKLASPAAIPNLLEMQKNSYDLFLQEARESKETFYTLDGALNSVFPMKDTAGIAELDYVGYKLETPKFDIDECRTRDLTFSAPCRVTLRLTVWDVDHATGARSVKDIKEQEVYLADVPLMTSNGTFIVNGTERVVVSQMQRSPGVFFGHDDGTTHSSGKLLFNARIIPFRGSWLDFEFDHKDNIHVRIDRKRKLAATIILRALGMSTQEILDTYYDKLTVKVSGGAPAKKPKPPKKLTKAQQAKLDKEAAAAEAAAAEAADGKKSKAASKTKAKKVEVKEEASTEGTAEYALQFEPMFYEGVKLNADLIDADKGKVVAEAGKKPTRRTMRKATEDGIKWVKQSAEELQGRFLAHTLVDEESGEVLFEAGDEITEDVLEAIHKLGLKKFEILKIDHLNVGAYIRNTIMVDKTSTPEEALVEIYKVMRPGEPPTVEAGQKLFQGMFFDFDRFDLSAVGRMKTNARLFGTKAKKDDENRVLTKEDFVETIRALHRIRDGIEDIDDIDNLSNRRVRLVGELMENQVRIGLLRMERSVKERMGSTEIGQMMPNDLINSRPLAAALREFFAGSQLSQFMDQTNPLSEVTHKRRLSALGPGGLSRERAGFEVRDVHTTHYGRICPVETPEGPNIGLINSLATYARINKYGFIETPYRKVNNGKVTEEVVYMAAFEEAGEVIAQANTELDGKGAIKHDFVEARKGGETLLMPKAEVTFMDVSPKQVVSVAAALIPFLEHDDANRALMGSNMQRQAVPLVRTDAPLVGTGMEASLAADSGVTTVARRAGVVESVDASRIVVRSTEKSKDGSGVDIYRLTKFQRSNQSSCLNQKPLVKKGDKVTKGDVIADGASTDNGELALGRNVVVAFMPWNGYNFEDSILISERIVREDIFTSIHIDEFETMARDTKLGAEEITRDIPNVSEEALGHLDEAGIVSVGAEVGPGDILVGKITPKGESPVTPEEKLLRAIFGEKAADVRDTSLRLPPGMNGTVVGVKIFNRRGNEKDTRTLEIEAAEIARLTKDIEDERRILEADALVRLKGLLVGQKSAAKAGKVAKGKEITADALEELKPAEWWTLSVSADKVQREVENLKEGLDKSLTELKKRFQEKSEKIRQADELPPGVQKMVKVFVAVKRKLQPGDKMAGRHGNKGVISKVNRIEDMPYLEDGRTVDMVLNPLGVPSRMNVGQILETHLGWASYNVGRKVAALIADAKSSKKPDTKELRKYLDSLYDGDAKAKSLKDLNDAEVITMAENLTKGMPVACPVFDGPTEDKIVDMLKESECDTSGKTQLYDGRSGEPYEQKTTVGIMYMLKLHHLVDEKIHARSIGPYSLVTQQPLGGKAQFGGQRFGEMEVWALQAYGASYTLQEMLTIKSDDVSGRTKTYEAIVRGETNFEAGVPESFNVLVKEIQALGLNVELVEKAPSADEGILPAIATEGFNA